MPATTSRLCSSGVYGSSGIGSSWSKCSRQMAKKSALVWARRMLAKTPSRINAQPEVVHVLFHLLHLTALDVILRGSHPNRSATYSSTSRPLGQEGGSLEMPADGWSARIADNPAPDHQAARAVSPRTDSASCGIDIAVGQHRAAGLRDGACDSRNARRCGTSPSPCAHGR